MLLVNGISTLSAATGRGSARMSAAGGVGFGAGLENEAASGSGVGLGGVLAGRRGIKSVLGACRIKLKKSPLVVLIHFFS